MEEQGKQRRLALPQPPPYSALISSLGASSARSCGCSRRGATSESARRRRGTCAMAAERRRRTTGAQLYERRIGSKGKINFVFDSYIVYTRVYLYTSIYIYVFKKALGSVALAHPMKKRPVFYLVFCLSASPPFFLYMYMYIYRCSYLYLYIPSYMYIVCTTRIYANVQHRAPNIKKFLSLVTFVLRWNRTWK